MRLQLTLIIIVRNQNLSDHLFFFNPNVHQNTHLYFPLFELNPNRISDFFGSGLSFTWFSVPYSLNSSSLAITGIQQGRKMSFPLKLFRKSFPFLMYTTVHLCDLSKFLTTCSWLSFIHLQLWFRGLISQFIWMKNNVMASHFLALLTLEWSVALFFFQLLTSGSYL